MDLVLAAETPESRTCKLYWRHLSFSLEATPPGHVHALDIVGLVDPAVTFFSARGDGVLLGVEAQSS